MPKYSVRYTTKSGSVGVINVFKTMADAEKQVKAARKSKSFKKLGWSRPRVVKER